MRTPPAPSGSVARDARLPRAVLTICLLVMMAASLDVRGAAADPLIGASDLDAYVVHVTPAEMHEISVRGLDVLDMRPSGDGMEVALALTPEEARGLELAGTTPRLLRHPDTGYTVAGQSDAILQEDEGYEVFRSWDEDGGIRDELDRVAEENPERVERIVIGESIQGREIVALRVTRDAAGTPQGTRPAVLYNAMQHSREWISVEVVRRLLHHFLDNDGQDPEITEMIDELELWFVPVANPDGYQFSFTEGNRLWRKNVRDNDEDGAIGNGDGVDINRNFSSRWNYDTAGSSGSPGSQTYRGPEPASEPETRALEELLQRLDFSFVVNYHSAAELILYPEGWQDETKTADHGIYTALAGDFFEPAIDGYVPTLSAGLYITNGETCDFAHSIARTLCFTPELSDSIGDDRFGFQFPDDEELVQGELELNLPFAMSIARSTANPTEPVTHLENTVDPIYADTFEVSYGDPQPVQATAQRKLGDIRMYYRINDDRARVQRTEEWDGGERYGDTGDVHFRRVRGLVVGAEPGDEVTVWFEGGDGEASEPFTYTQRSDNEHRVLVVAAEDYTGVEPEYENTEGPSYLEAYTSTLAALDLGHDVYDIDANGRIAPDPLGVLSHYEGVVWYTGDDTAPRTADRPEGTTSRETLDMMLALRDYLNEGGKVVYAGQYAGLPYARGLEFDRYADDICDPTTGQDGCDTLKFDFFRYYMGVTDLEGNTAIEGAEVVGADGGPFAGIRAVIGGTDSARNVLSYRLTSDIMPPEAYPLFAADSAAKFEGGGYKPFEGERVLYSGESNYSHQSITRTLDLTAVTDTARVRFAVLRQTRQPFDAFIVEARSVGGDDWTTLPDSNGHTSDSDARSCWSSAWFGIFPRLVHYMTPDEEADGECRPDGASGSWNAATGFSDGWEQWEIDLAPYLGTEVELHLSYLSSRVAFDGVYLDDLAVFVSGEEESRVGFEDGLGPWSIGNVELPDRDPERTFEIVGADAFPGIEGSAIVAAEDSVLMGFGLEALASQEHRDQILRAAVVHLGVDPSNPPERPEDPPLPPYADEEADGTVYLPVLLSGATIR